jgi:hypothetical protein
VKLGVNVSEVFHPAAPGAQFGQIADGQAGGPADDRAGYGSFATFHDPDGNSFLLQEITARIPGRIDSGITTYGSLNDLIGALKRRRLPTANTRPATAASTTRTGRSGTRHT